MTSIALLLMLCFPFITSVFAISTPLQAPSSNAPLNLLQPLNASHLTGPILPASYQIVLKFNETILLNPLGLYVNAIELMYKLAQQEWDGLFLEGFRMSVTTFNIYIQVAKTPSNMLEVSHVVIALQDSVIAMARLSGFYRLSSLISLHGHAIGQLDFGNNDDASHKGDLEDASPLLINNHSESSLSTSGQIVDPLDSKFVIEYEFFGIAIDSKEIFTVALEGMAISAQYEPNSECPFLEAESVSGTAAISISKNLSKPTQLRYSAVTKILLLLVTGVIIPQRQFKEVEFFFWYDEVEVAEGYMFKTAMANNGTGGRSAIKQVRT